MKSIFLSPEQLFDKPLPMFTTIGTEARASDLAVLTAPDDGFLLEGSSINYYIGEDASVDRFGRLALCKVCAVRPVLLLEEGEENLLRRRKEEGNVVTVEFGFWPTVILDASLREMAEREFLRGSLRQTGQTIHVDGKPLTVWQFGAKRMIRVEAGPGGINGFVQLSDQTAVTEGESVFLELRPVRWLYDASRHLLVSGLALFAGLDREEAATYLNNDFLKELSWQDNAEIPENAPFRLQQHDELSLIRAYVQADIPLFLHGLAGDGKSDRVRQVDPDVLDIELVNENPETINGRAVYNEAKDEIVDIKPVWLVKLERLCEDGQLHILFFDELTNATKQTQSVIFKIVLERYVTTAGRCRKMRASSQPEMTAVSPPLPMISLSRSSAASPISISVPRWKTGCPGLSSITSTRLCWNFLPITTCISAHLIPAPKAMPIRAVGRWFPRCSMLREMTFRSSPPSSDAIRPMPLSVSSVPSSSLLPSVPIPMKSSNASASPVNTSWHSSVCTWLPQRRMKPARSLHASGRSISPGLNTF